MSTIETGTSPVRFDDLTDADLLDAWVSDRNHQAMDALFHRYAAVVYQVCLRHCRSHCDAEDAMQMTFFYLAKSAGSIRKPEYLPGWLHRVAQRSSLATMKSHSDRPLDDADVPSRPDDPFQRLTRRHEALVLDEELSDLPARYRTALVLHLMDRHSIAAIADRMQTTTGSVRGWIQRGKQRLAKRLRHRGVVPVVAVATVTSWARDAAAATAELDLDSPPVDPPDWDHPPSESDFSSLETLLQSGQSIMTSTLIKTSALAALATVALGLTTLSVGQPAHDGTSTSIQGLPPSNQIPVALAQGDDADQGMEMEDAYGMGMEGGYGAMQEEDDGMGGMGGMMGGYESSIKRRKPGSLAGTTTYRPPSTVVDLSSEDSPLVVQIRQALDRSIDWNGLDSLKNLPRFLGQEINVPVLLDDNGLGIAGVSPDHALRRPESSQDHVRTGLRVILRPLGLRAEIQDDGLVITADMNQLTRQGIATDRWLDTSGEQADRLDQILDSKITVQYIETPVQEVAMDLARELGFPIVLDLRAMEELGLSSDMPVTFMGKDLSARSVLSAMLKPLDMTYTYADETLTLTTVDANPERLRIYYLEGLGINPGDPSGLIELIQATIEPEHWESMGGTGTIVPLPSSGALGRPGLVVNAPDSIHHRIEQMLAGLRRSDQPAALPNSPMIDDTAATRPTPRPQADPSQSDAPPADTTQGARARRPQPKPDPFGNDSGADDPFGPNHANNDPFGGPAGQNDPFGSKPFGN
ncbi:RNA polymerase sigma factor [Crateriforma conspicua]|uniref:RNA polymerase sigma factor n=1 Tax=Crateriforma conspicua TaxID=2527996 RepID=UPI00118AB286|nr:sigma-70 family RNA polymerase sigma factor [Crateriforma conspicua]QDV66196.1 ECF RNA polymerase sigma factor SigW [Crateriforma conspicua]